MPLIFVLLSYRFFYFLHWIFQIADIIMCLFFDVSHIMSFSPSLIIIIIREFKPKRTKQQTAWLHIKIHWIGDRVECNEKNLLLLLSRHYRPNVKINSSTKTSFGFYVLSPLSFFVIFSHSFLSLPFRFECQCFMHVV